MLCPKLVLWPVNFQSCGRNFRTYEQVTHAFGWRQYQRPAPNGSKRRGIGFAAHEWGGGGNPPAYAWVKINGDGTAGVITGAQDIGTGARTGLLLVAAEELGLPVDAVTVHLGDTATGPCAPTSAGSATKVTVGPAVRAAAADAKRQLLEAAAKLLEEDEPTQLHIHNGVISVNFACWLKGGDDCPAYTGENQHHALFGGGPCYAVHPSDLAAALLALEATVRLRGCLTDR